MQIIDWRVALPSLQTGKLLIASLIEAVSVWEVSEGILFLSGGDLVRQVAARLGAVHDCQRGGNAIGQFLRQVAMACTTSEAQM
jgi:hypothetical protein